MAAPAALTSDVFLEVFGELDTFRGGQRQFRTWVFQVAHRRLTGGGPAEDDPKNHPAGDPVADPRADPEADLGGECQAWLVRVSTILSPDQRTVLALRIAGGLTAAEVAGITGRPVGTIRAWQREGLIALRRRLAEDQPTGTPCE